DQTPPRGQGSNHQSPASFQSVQMKRTPLAVGLLLVAGLLVGGCGGGQPNHRAGAASPGRGSGNAAGRSVAAAARRTLSLTAGITFTLDGAAAFGTAHAPVF